MKANGTNGAAPVDAPPAPLVAPQKPALVTPKHGQGKLYRGGVPGNKGGRPKGSGFVQLFEKVRDDPKVQKAILQAARSGKHTNHVNAIRMAASYDPNRPTKDTPPTHIQVGVIVMPPEDASG